MTAVFHTVVAPFQNTEAHTAALAVVDGCDRLVVMPTGYGKAAIHSWRRRGASPRAPITGAL